MIRARASRKFAYTVVNPMYMVQLGLAQATEHKTVKAREVLTFETMAEFEELRGIAREMKSDLIKL
jgi:hypothetical protein